jgi:hypothetical protein
MLTVKCASCKAKINLKTKKRIPENYQCRKCKIIETTRDDKFKKSASQLSKLKLSNPDIKSKMSIKASLSNVKNAEKIKESLKKFYSNDSNKESNSNKIKAKWQDPEYRKKVTESISNKWKDPIYRNKITSCKMIKDITKSFKKNQNEKVKIRNYLTNNSIPFSEEHCIHVYKFDFFINGLYLVDLERSNEKKIFIEHYFKNLKYINTLKEMIK